MKRLIFALLLILALALPVGAAQSFGVLVNGERLQESALMQDGRVYVPLRAIGESLGAEVSWDGQNASVTLQAAEADYSRPVIEGDAAFKKMINEALDLLYQKDAAHYALVVQNVDVIKQAKADNPFDQMRYGFKPYATSLGRSVTFYPAFIESKHFIPTLVAGTLSHEAAHSAYYSIHGARGDYDEEEAIAYAHEIATLKLVDAPEWAIRQREGDLKKHLN